jgi:hypothetical protein
MNWFKQLFARTGCMPKYENPPPPPEPMLEPELITLLENSDWRVLVEWWSTLNSWGWPEELLPEESPRDRQGQRRTRIMNFIDNKLGHKTVLWHINVNIDKGMTSEEFEDFWQFTRNHCKHAEKRYFAAMHKRQEKERAGFEK